MKRSFKVLTIIITLLLVFIITGCGKDKIVSKFKHPKTITISNNKSKVSLTYDDNGKYDADKVSKKEIILTNTSKNFRIDFMYGNQSIEKQKKSMRYAKADGRLLVLNNIIFNKYSGYVSINRKYGTSDIYLYMNKDTDTVVNIRISTTNTTKILKELKTSDPEEVLFEQDYIQDILETVEYKK